MNLGGNMFIDFQDKSCCIKDAENDVEYYIHLNKDGDENAVYCHSDAPNSEKKPLVLHSTTLKLLFCWLKDKGYC